jgi:hypothetical protein
VAPQNRRIRRSSEWHCSCKYTDDAFDLRCHGLGRDGRNGFNAFCMGALAALIVAAAFIAVASRLGVPRVPRH